MIKLALTDDHSLVTEGVISMLAPFPQICIAGVYRNGADLLDGLSRELPDVLLLDLMLPDRNGRELVGEIKTRYPALGIIALTSHDAPALVSGMMRRGCSGYLLKDVAPQTLLTAIETVHAGGEFVEPTLKEKLLRNLLHFQEQNSRSTLPVITRREKEVLQLIAEEYSTQEIADKLFISFKTVENHRQNLMHKLDVKNTAGLIKIAIQSGLVN